MDLTGVKVLLDHDEEIVVEIVRDETPDRRKVLQQEAEKLRARLAEIETEIAALASEGDK